MLRRGRARSSARGALLAETGADYAVGIEGGVVGEVGLRSVAYVAIRRSRDGWESVEHTASFELPPRVARLLRGEEPGHDKLERAPRAISCSKQQTRSSKAAPWAP